jgi:hypothetical protein
METIQLTRKELYELVWSTPLTKIAKKYTINSDGIKKICKEFNVPMPPNGYWSKIKFNKALEKDKLQEDFKGEDKIELTLKIEGEDDNSNQTPLTIAINQIKKDVKAPIRVPSRLVNPDKLTIQTQEYWEREKKERYYRDDAKVILPIRVEKNNKERALRFMDALVKLLKYKGHSFVKKNHEFFIVVDEIEMLLDLREAKKRVPSTSAYTTSDYIPTGEFILKIGQYYKGKEWRDGKIKLEDLLPNIVAKIEIDAEAEKAQNEENRKHWLKWEEAEQIKKDAKRRVDEEIEKFNKLLQTSEQFSKAQLIRQYIEAVKQKAIAENNLTTEKQNWINWSNDKADWYDPTINKSDELLDM